MKFNIKSLMIMDSEVSNGQFFERFLAILQEFRNPTRRCSLDAFLRTISAGLATLNSTHIRRTVSQNGSWKVLKTHCKASELEPQVGRWRRVILFRTFRNPKEMPFYWYVSEYTRSIISHERIELTWLMKLAKFSQPIYLDRLLAAPQVRMELNEDQAE